MAAQTHEERVLELETELEKLIEFANSCKINVDGDITALNKKVSNLESILEDHASQRAISHFKLESALKELSRWFEQHDKNEMDKYSEMAEKYEQLAQKHQDVLDEIRAFIVMTKDNTEYIEKEKAEEDKKKAIEEEVARLTAPQRELEELRKARKEKVITAVWVSGSLALLSVLGTGTYGLIKLIFSPLGQAILESAK